MPERCGVVEVRNLADAVGYACSRTASTQCSDCGICANHTRKPVARVARSSARPVFSFIERNTRSPRTGNVESEKELKKPPNCGFVDVQGFFQSVRVISSSRISCNRWSRRSWSAAAPPSLLCICVRFASDLGYFFLKFLDTLYTNFGINTA